MTTEYSIPHENYTDPEFYHGEPIRDDMRADPNNIEYSHGESDFREENFFEFGIEDLPEDVLEQISKNQEEIAEYYQDYYKTFEGRLDMWRATVNVYGDPSLEEEILAWFHPNDEEELALLEYIQYEFRELDPEENTAVLRLLTRALKDKETYTKQVLKNIDEGKLVDTSIESNVPRSIEFLWNLVDQYTEDNLPKDWFVDIESN